MRQNLSYASCNVCRISFLILRQRVTHSITKHWDGIFKLSENLNQLKIPFGFWTSLSLADGGQGKFCYQARGSARHQTRTSSKTTTNIVTIRQICKYILLRQIKTVKFQVTGHISSSEPSKHNTCILPNWRNAKRSESYSAMYVPYFQFIGCWLVWVFVRAIFRS
jgi:hypothetical protein